jgi:ClpP class serine protease
MPSSFSLLKALSQTFLIADDIAEKLLPELILALDKDNALTVNIAENKIGAYALSNTETGFLRYTNFDEAALHSIAVIEVRGVIMKESSCWDVGTAALKQQATQAAQHPNIAAVLFIFDSGGGAVAGTEVFGQTIKAVSEQHGKPTLAFVEDMAASAAYWLASCCTQIWASSKTAQIGSIGVAAEIRDTRELLSRQGIKTHYIRATDSTAKNEDFIQAKEGKFDLMRKNSLDPINTVFQDVVCSNRPNLLIDSKTKAPLNGAMYLSEAAQALGLIEGICTFEAAVSHLFEMSHHNLNTTPEPMFGANKFKQIAALKGKTGADISAAVLEKANEELETEGITGVGLVTEAFVEKAEADALQASQASTLQTQLDAANTQISDLKKGDKTTALSDLQTKYEAANARIAVLEKDNKKPGDTHSLPPKTGAEGDGTAIALDAEWNNPESSFNVHAKRVLGE